MISMLSCDKTCSHEWIEANCQNPKTCSVCGTTEGSPASSHNFVKDKCETCGLIQLTLDNYEDYLECTVTAAADDRLKYDSYHYTYTSMTCVFKCQGNPHYKYNDVVIVVNFYHYNHEGYMQYLTNSILSLRGEKIEKEAVPFSSSETILKLNLAGNGSCSCSLWTDWSGNYRECSDSDALRDQTFFEIVSISGTVEEY